MRFSFVLIVILITNLSAFSINPDSLRLMGIDFKSKGKYDSALVYYNLAQELYIVTGDSVGLANVLSNRASIEGIRGNYVDCFSLYERALTIYSLKNNHDGVIKSYINIANQFLKTESYQEALDNYLKSKEFADELRYQKYDGYIYNGLGNVLSNRNNEERDLPKARSYYLEALVIFEKNNDLSNIGRLYNNLAIIYDELGETNLSIDAYNKCLDAGLKEGNYSLQLTAYHNLGKLYLENRDYNLSLINLEIAEKLTVQISDPVRYIHILSNLIDVYISLGQVEKSKLYLEKYKDIRDSLYNEDKLEALSELQIKYKTKEKEELLAKEIELREETKLRNTFLSILLLLLLVVIFLIVFINRRRRQYALGKAKQEHEIESLRASIEGENKERKRLASDLHDSVGGMLTAVRMIHSRYKDIGGEKGAKVDQLLNEVSNTIRTVSHNLSTNTLERHGLIKSLEQAVDAIPEEFEVNFMVDIKQQEVPIEIARPIDFVIKELINNTIKHSKAQSIDIQMSCYDSTLIITYEDDGLGFDMSQMSSGMGLTSIQKRVELINGTINIDSNPGDGFVCSIEIKVGGDK